MPWVFLREDGSGGLKAVGPYPTSDSAARDNAELAGWLFELATPEVRNTVHDPTSPFIPIHIETLDGLTCSPEIGPSLVRLTTPGRAGGESHEEDQPRPQQVIRKLRRAFHLRSRHPRATRWVAERLQP
jgi:hypothetical protein